MNEEVGDTCHEEDGSFVDIDAEGRIGGAGMVGKWVEVREGARRAVAQ